MEYIMDGKTFFLISRHTGTVKWLQHRLPAKKIVEIEHLDGLDLPEGAIVVGTLPISKVAALAQKGIPYLHLSIDIPHDLRGTELSAEKLDELGAKLVPYTAHELKDFKL